MRSDWHISPGIHSDRDPAYTVGFSHVPSPGSGLAYDSLALESYVPKYVDHEPITYETPTKKTKYKKI